MEGNEDDVVIDNLTEEDDVDSLGPLHLSDNEETDIGGVVTINQPVTPFFLPQYNEEEQPRQKTDPVLASALAKQDQTPEEFVERMIKLFDEGEIEQFETSLIAYFCKNVYTIFSPSDDLNYLLCPTHDEELIRKLLIIPLNKIFLGGYTGEFMEFVRRTNVTDCFCGKVFRAGEATYSCRDCGVDPTCVLCAECFQHSQHTTHRYKIGSSSGGGYCDCGDPEAWKKHTCCIKHIAASLNSERKKQQIKLSDRQRRIAVSVLKTILHYANEVLSNQYAVSVESIPNLTESPLLKDGKPLFASILYNDEVHTFELVIHALTRTLPMEKKVAADIANKVDRDGRAFVHIGSFSECLKVKDGIQRFAQRNIERPLKVEIRQSALLAHQFWAEYLLQWLIEILDNSSQFRSIFAKFATERQYSLQNTFINTILLNDVKFWKYVRTLWHNLIVAGFLKDYEYKLLFAQAFANSYCEMMSELSEDDQDHANSVTALSVQILTVPSIAYFLIEKYDFFFTIMRAIMSEVDTRLDENGVVLYEKRGNDSSLRRTHFGLLDLKYLLTTTPEPNQLTHALRKHFMSGLIKFFHLLRCLQGSDPITRRVGDHLEYEPEWEAPFNLHIKLSPVMTHVLEWCASDPEVCLKAYHSIIKEIRKLKVSKEPRYENIVGGHKADCSYYELGREPVSIYCALTRLEAGLFVKLADHGWVTDQRVQHSVTPDVIMEPSLRALTVLAQQHVGLWKRNGFSLSNQMYFYQSVKCRGDMFDKDILALQVGLCQLDPNVFIMQVLMRMELLPWAQGQGYRQNYVGWRDSSDGLRFMQPLTEELMLMIMYVVSGRFVPGVGAVTRLDCTKKHIIQALCIGPMTHSELNKCLSENVHGETGIEDVVRDITHNRKTQQGDVYELKAQFYSDYDVFFYHYTREDASKAEDTQRARKVFLKETDFFIPPRLPRFTGPFQEIVRIFHSDLLMMVLKASLTDWLKVATSSSAEKYSESMLQKTCHLICYGINEELDARDRSESSIGFVKKMSDHGIIELLEKAIGILQSFSQKEIIFWILNTCKSFQSSPAFGSEVHSPEALIQKEIEEEKLRKDKAAAARQRNLEKMAGLQKRFRTANADLFETEVQVQEPESELNSIEAICLGPTKTAASGPEELTCIVCKAMSKDAFDGPNAFVVGCYIQLSTVLAQTREQPGGTPFGLLHHDPYVPLPSPAWGMFMGSCGHVMHRTCWQHNCSIPRGRRQYRPLGQLDPDFKEYFCPMCNSPLNAVMPVFPGLHLIGPSPELGCKFPDFDNFRQFLSQTLRSDWTSRPEDHIWAVDYQLSTQELETLVFITDLHWKNPQAYVPAQIVQATEDFMKRVIESIPRNFIPLDEHMKEPESSFHKSLVGLWNSIAYTIQSIEASSKELKIPFFGNEIPSRHQNTLKYLTRLGGSVIDSSNTLQVRSAQFIGLRTIQIMFRKLHANNFTKPDMIVVETIDAFSLFVAATYSLRFVFFPEELGRTVVPRCGNDIDGYIFRIIFAFHMLQALLEIHPKKFSIPDEMVEEDENSSLIYRVYHTVWGLDYDQPMDYKRIERTMEAQVVSFVTCCCKFYEHYTGIEPIQLQGLENPLASMLKYLGQSIDINTYFEADEMMDLMIKHAAASLPQFRLGVYPRVARPLAVLPINYLQLINSVANFACEKNKTMGLDSRHPAMCLICETIVCSQSNCCQLEVGGSTLGACTIHTRRCGMGTGIFLRIRDCKAFIISGPGKGAFIPPPYVDEYGETDEGLRRGNPLYFSQEKYNSIRKLWKEHGIHDEIIRLNEINQNVASFMYTDWSRM